MKFCPYCGADLLDDNVLFCGQCGKKLGVRGLRSLSIGETLSLYVADNTPVYSVEGSNVICNYITLSKALPTVKKEIQTQ